MKNQTYSMFAASVCAAALVLSGCASNEPRPVHRQPSKYSNKAKHRDDRRDDRRDRRDDHRDRRDDRDDRRDDRGDRSEWNRAPSVGMTKSEVRRRYGAPVEVSSTPQGEVWFYTARVSGRDFIPIYGAVTHRRNGGSIGFDSHGRVSAFQWGRDYRNAWWY